MNRLSPRRLAGAAVIATATVSATACGGNVGSAVNVAATPTPIAAAASSVGNVGVAYLPDGGNVSGFTGVQAAHFEDPNGGLLPSSALQNVAFPGSVASLAIASDGSVGIAAESTGAAAPFTRLQDVFGVASGNILPSGASDDTTVGGILPTTAPVTLVTPAPAATANPSATPDAAAVVPNLSSVAVLGTGTNSVGLGAGSTAAGFVAATSLANSPPVFGGFVPFASATSIPLPAGQRGNLQVSADLRTALVRGTDLLAYSISQVSSGFQFTLSAENATLGVTPYRPISGRGAFAIDPADSSRAVFAEAPTANAVTLVTGLPSSLTISGSVTLGSTPRSVAIFPNGSYALVGADAGVYVLSGVNGSTLTALPTFAGGAGNGANALPFTGCDAQPHVLANVTSVGVSVDGKYGVAFGNVPSGCPGGNGVIVAFPLNLSTGGLATPAPNPSPSATPFAQYFTQTGLGAQPTSADAMFVR